MLIGKLHDAIEQFDLLVSMTNQDCKLNQLLYLANPPLDDLLQRIDRLAVSFSKFDSSSPSSGGLACCLEGTRFGHQKYINRFPCGGYLLLIAQF